MKMNAAEMMSKLLSQCVAATGYALTLDSLKLHSMLVDHGALVVDVDADMSIDRVTDGQGWIWFFVILPDHRESATSQGCGGFGVCRDCAKLEDCHGCVATCKHDT